MGRVEYKIDYSYGLPSDTATLCYNADRAFYSSTHGFNNLYVISVIDAKTKQMRMKNRELSSTPTDIAYGNGYMVEQMFISDGSKRVKEPMGCVKWEVLPETKTILNYTCQKATATFRGRSYTAWFTVDIAVEYGPWKFTGLPGLILEVTENTGYFGISAVKVNSGERCRVKRINSRNALSFEEYNAWFRNYLTTEFIGIYFPDVKMENSPYEVILDDSVFTETME